MRAAKSHHWTGCVVLRDGRPIRLADSDDAAMDMAKALQRTQPGDMDDAFATYSIARVTVSVEAATIINLPPRDSVPDALVEPEFKQLRG
jgi:hypothetical protein